MTCHHRERRIKQECCTLIFLACLIRSEITISQVLLVLLALVLHLFRNSLPKDAHVCEFPTLFFQSGRKIVDFGLRNLQLIFCSVSFSNEGCLRFTCVLHRLSYWDHALNKRK